MGNKLGVFLAGGLVGAVAALLCAPRTGSETRNMVAEKANAVWGEAQELGAQTASTAQQVVEDVAGADAAARTQTFAQDAVARGQNVVSAVASKGQEIYGAAASRVQEVKGGVKPAPDSADDLREKIEAARARIAAQVARNAEESAAAASEEIPVEVAQSEAPAAGASEGERA